MTDDLTISDMLEDKPAWVRFCLGATEDFVAAKLGEQAVKAMREKAEREHREKQLLEVFIGAENIVRKHHPELAAASPVVGFLGKLSEAQRNTLIQALRAQLEQPLVTENLRMTLRTLLDEVFNERQFPQKSRAVVVEALFTAIDRWLANDVESYREKRGHSHLADTAATLRRIEDLLTAAPTSKHSPAVVPLIQASLPAPTPEDIAAAYALLASMPAGAGAQIPEPGGHLPSGSYCPPRNPRFVGRETELRELAALLKAKPGTLVITAVTGTGGIGKSQLAVEFAHRYGYFFAGGIFFLSFVDPQKMPKEFAACLSNGLDGLPNAKPELLTYSQDIQADLVKARFAMRLPRLVVFDNCEDPELLRKWAPVYGGTRVLVTSRRQEWPSDVSTWELNVLSEDASVRLLRSFRPKLSEGHAREIAKELGYLALALHLAGSFLKRYSTTHHGDPADYIAALRSVDVLNHPSLMGRGADQSEPSTARELHVARAFAISSDALYDDMPSNQMARELLARMACVAPGEGLPETMLLRALPDGTDELDVTDALIRLCDLGLLTRREDQTCVVHRLVAFHAQGLPGVDHKAALNAVQHALTSTYLDPSKLFRQGMHQFVAHLRYVSSRFESDGDYLSAVPLIERVLDISEQSLGPEDPSIASDVMKLAELQEAAGEYVPARSLYEKALAIREHALGREHPDVASSISKLAGLLRAMGDYSAAKPLYEQALAIRESVLGSGHRDTASSLNNLAAVLDDSGNYAAARPLYERALAIREQALGPDHPDTAGSLNNLAALLSASGDYGAARPLYERALAIREQALGPDHPDTAQSLNNLAGLHYATGDYGAARPLFERALAIAEQALGPDHPSTATSLNNLAGLLERTGDYGAARPLYERALAIAEKNLGPSHPQTAGSLNNLALLLSNAGDYGAARPLYERALAIDTKVYGPDHPEVATDMNNLAGLFKSTGDYGAARPLYERALAIREQALGPDHRDTAQSLNNLAGLHYATGDYGAARPLYERALGAWESSLGPNHPNVASALNNLAVLLANSGELEASLPFFERAHRILLASLGENHPNTRTVARLLQQVRGMLGGESEAGPDDDVKTRLGALAAFVQTPDLAAMRAMLDERGDLLLAEESLALYRQFAEQVANDDSAPQGLADALQATVRMFEDCKARGVEAVFANLEAGQRGDEG